MKSCLGYILLLAAGWATPPLSSGLIGADTERWGNFRNPLREAWDATWWHWIQGNASKEGITKDLEAFARLATSRGGDGEPGPPREQGEALVGGENRLRVREATTWVKPPHSRFTLSRRCQLAARYSLESWSEPIARRMAGVVPEPGYLASEQLHWVRHLQVVDEPPRAHRCPPVCGDVGALWP